MGELVLAGWEPDGCEESGTERGPRYQGHLGTVMLLVSIVE